MRLTLIFILGIISHWTFGQQSPNETEHKSFDLRKNYGVQWINPAEKNTTQSGNTITLKIIIRDAQKVSTSKWFVNGNLQNDSKIGFKEHAIKNAKTLEQTFNLNNGNNTISLQLKYIDGKIYEFSRYIRVDYQNEAPTHKTYAILIGVEDYESPTNNFSNLSNPSPIDQIEKIKNTLDANYAFEQVEQLPNATKADFLNILNYHQSVLRPQDQLLILFSGHGTKNKWHFRNSEGSQDSINVMHKSELWCQLSNLPTQHIFIIVDACQGGSFLESNLDVEPFCVFPNQPNTAPSVTSNCQDYLNRKSFRGLSSGSGNEEVWNSDQFTDALIDALESGKNDECLTDEDIYDRIKTSIRNINRKAPIFNNIPFFPLEGGHFVFPKR